MYEYAARIINVVDGDTVDIDLDLGLYLHSTQRLRLLGVNCPEVHGPTRAAGLAAAEFTRTTLLGKDVKIQTAKSDAFGRWLARIFVQTRLGEVDFNLALIDAGHAVPFMVGQRMAQAMVREDD